MSKSLISINVKPPQETKALIAGLIIGIAIIAIYLILSSLN